MPLLKFSCILSFSSEDPNHPADNLLSLHTFRKWRIAQSECGKPASVTLKLDKLATITSLDIGNDGSAFVEALVARDDEDFQVLLPTSSFMSPVESRNGTDSNRVRMFTSRHLNKNVAAQKWTRVKLVCSQPFNKHSPFGLTFVALTSDSQQASQKDNESSSAIAGLPLEDSIHDDATSQQPSISVGAFFAKRRKLDNHQNEMEQSSKNSQRSGCVSTEVAKSSEADVSAAQGYGLGRKTEGGRQHTGNRAAHARPTGRPASPAPSAASAALTSSSSGNKPHARDQAARTRPTGKPVLSSSSPASPAVTSLSGTSKASDSIGKQLVCRSKASPAGEVASSSSKSQARSSLLRGVIYTMSGYQNPQRSLLRDKMTAMGASYRPDWTDDCTHLICAFSNTPKFRAVQGKGRIVNHRWIEECYLFRKKMPWKKYALEQDVSSWPDSPEPRGPTPVVGGLCSVQAAHSGVWCRWVMQCAGRPLWRLVQVGCAVCRPPTLASGAGGLCRQAAHSGVWCRWVVQAGRPLGRLVQVGCAVCRPPTRAPVVGTCSESSRHERGQAKEENLQERGQAKEENSEQQDEEENWNYEGDTDNEDTDDEIQRSLNPGAGEADNKQATAPGRSSPGSLSSPSEHKRLLPTEDTRSSDSSAYLTDTDEDHNGHSPALVNQQIDLSQLKFIPLPDLFLGERFFLHRSCEEPDCLHRYIIAFNGVISDYMNNSVKFVVTEAAWDQSFAEATREHDAVRFVKPSWIWQCVDTSSRVPLEPHVITPP
ncbi:DNA ligase 3 BRCT domain [Trinorchestia longiramus]|nr:DNA ligase 3 BRCT domain [Trinorchestia longiramus]